LRLAKQAISLDPNFAAAYGVALACYVFLADNSWITDDDVVEGKKYAFRAVEVGADDASALAWAASFLARILNDTGTADVIVDQAIAVNPNLFVAWLWRGWVAVLLGQHEPALEQFHHAMRLNPLDPEIFTAEAGLAWANFFLRRFEIALSWATKSLARQKNFVPAISIARMSNAMLGRIADAQAMLARRREAGTPVTISRIRKRFEHFRQEDVELIVEAYRIAGVSE
jgi:tetratricopeptide (TPR) repeat protein